MKNKLAALGVVLAAVCTVYVGILFLARPSAGSFCDASLSVLRKFDATDVNVTKLELGTEISKDFFYIPLESVAIPVPKSVLAKFTIVGKRQEGVGHPVLSFLGRTDETALTFGSLGGSHFAGGELDVSQYFAIVMQDTMKRKEKENTPLSAAFWDRTRKENNLNGLRLNQSMQEAKIDSVECSINSPQNWATIYALFAKGLIFKDKADEKITSISEMQSNQISIWLEKISEKGVAKARYFITRDNDSFLVMTVTYGHTVSNSVLMNPVGIQQINALPRPEWANYVIPAYLSKSDTDWNAFAQTLPSN